MGEVLRVGEHHGSKGGDNAPLPGPGRSLLICRVRDTTDEKTHGGRGREPIREIPAKDSPENLAEPRRGFTRNTVYDQRRRQLTVPASSGIKVARRQARREMPCGGVTGCEHESH